MAELGDAADSKSENTPNRHPLKFKIKPLYRSPGLRLARLWPYQDNLSITMRYGSVLAHFWLIRVLSAGRESKLN
jgi:hypothetical protein